MKVDTRLLSILACPLCKTEIKLTADEKGLKCLTCNRVYPIRDEIPVLIIDEATIEPSRPVKP
jgi:hypothetical protein